MATTLLPKVKRLCWLVRGVAIALVGSVLVLYLSTWVFPDLAIWDQHWAKVARIGGFPPTAARDLVGSDRFLFGAVCLPYLASLVWAFRHLGLMLRGFERGEFFERSTIAHLRAFSGFLLLAKALSLLAAHARFAIYVPVVSHPKVMFNVTSDDLALLLLCALIFLIAHLMEEGNRLAEENRSFL